MRQMWRKPHDRGLCCTLCLGANTANYKGCTIYNDLQLARDKQITRAHPNATRPLTSNSHSPIRSTSHYIRDGTSFSQVLSNTNQAEKSDTLSLQLHSFLQEFKNMFTQLINQNRMILNTLTTVVTSSQQLAVNTLRITQCKANGLANHKPELHQFLHDSNTDILLVSETHFTDRTVFKLPGYSTYHCNHPDGTAHGGVAILIRATLQHNEAPPYQSNHIQAAIARIHTCDWSLNVAAMYSPPNTASTFETTTPFFIILAINSLWAETGTPST